MTVTEKRQLQSRGLLATIAFSNVKNFFDSAGIEINGDGKGE